VLSIWLSFDHRMATDFTSLPQEKVATSVLYLRCRNGIFLLFLKSLKIKMVRSSMGNEDPNDGSDDCGLAELDAAIKSTSDSKNNLEKDFETFESRIRGCTSFNVYQNVKLFTTKFSDYP
jgi:hypothetical protein